MTTRTYTQVQLVRTGDGSATHTVAWIPTKFAKQGKYLHFGDGVAWRVLVVERTMDEQFVLNRRDDYRYQRRVSDA